MKKILYVLEMVFFSVGLFVFALWAAATMGMGYFRLYFGPEPKPCEITQPAPETAYPYAKPTKKDIWL